MSDEGYLQKQVLSRRVVTPEDTAQARADKKQLAANDSSLILVDENDPRYQAAIMNRKCGFCIHFDVELCQRAMREQQFVERIVKDDKWRENWFNDYSSYGACRIFSDSSGLRVNDPNAPGICAASDLDSSLPMGSKEGSVQVLCEYYENRADRGQFATSSRAGVRGPTRRSEESLAYVREHDDRRRRGGKVR